MDRRFMALRVVATVFKVLAWLALLVGFLGAIGALLGGFLFSNQTGIAGIDISGPLAGIAMFVVMLIIAILYFLLLYAGGEFIYLSLSIEENTRRTAYFFQQQYMSQQAPYPVPPETPAYND